MVEVPNAQEHGHEHIRDLYIDLGLGFDHLRKAGSLERNSWPRRFSVVFLLGNRLERAWEIKLGT
jgi:hypothetical protein